MITYDASLFKDSFENAKTYPKPCQTSKVDFFLEYSQKLKAVYYFHKNRVKMILNTTLECVISWKRKMGKLIKLWLKLSMF